MRCSLAVFDLAGTTIVDDDAVSGALLRAMEPLGLGITPADVRGVMGLSKTEAIARLLRERGGPVTAERVHEIHARFVDAMLARYAAPDGVREIEGAAGLFEALRSRGCAVAIDTGFPRRVADAVVSRLGWRERELVRTVVASDDVERGRPHPDMILLAMARVGVGEPRAVAKIGDTPADLEEGTRARCGWVVGVTYGTHTAEALEPHPHTHLVDDLSQVLDVLEGRHEPGRVRGRGRVTGRPLGG